MTIDPKSSQAPSIFDVISWVETKRNFTSVRFEPATYAKLSVARTDSQKVIIAAIQKANVCSWGTALMIYSSSWGAAQVMGFNLYGPRTAYGKSVFDFCADETAQKFVFGSVLKEMGLDQFSVADLAVSKVTRARFALSYNGSCSYADEIVSALQHFGISVEK